MTASHPEHSADTICVRIETGTARGARFLACCAAALPYVLLLLVTILTSLPYRRSFFALDDGLYYYEAIRILHGEVIYRDFFEFVTPGVFFFIAGIFRLCGHQILVVRDVLFILLSVEVWMIYWLARRVLRRRIVAFLPPLLYILTAKCQTWWAIDHHALSNTLALVCAVLLVRHAETPRLWRVFLIGLAAGTAVCITQHLGLALIGVAFFWVLIWRPARPGVSVYPSVIGLVSGIAVPLGACLVYLAVNGALRDAYACTVSWVLSSYRVYHAVPYYNDGRLQMLHDLAGLPSLSSFRQVLFHLVSGYLPPLALIAGAIRFVVGAFKSLQRGERNSSLTIYGIVLSVGMVIFGQVIAQPTTFFIRQTSALAYVFALGFLVDWWRFSRVPLVSCRISPIPAEKGTAIPNALLRLSIKWSTAAWRAFRAGLRFEMETSSEDDSPKYAGIRFSVIERNIPMDARCLGSFAAALLLGLVFCDVSGRLYAIHQHHTATRPLRAYVDTPVGRFWTTDSQLASDVTAMRRYVDARTGINDRIFVYYWSAYVYCVLDRHCAVRYSGTLPGYHNGQQNAEMVKAIERHEPALIVADHVVDMLRKWSDTRILSYGIANLEREPIAVAVKRHYVPVLILKNFTVLAPASSPLSQREGSKTP